METRIKIQWELFCTMDPDPNGDYDWEGMFVGFAVGSSYGVVSPSLARQWYWTWGHIIEAGLHA